MSKPTENQIHELINYMRPYVVPIVERINVDEFTTNELIEALQLEEESRRAYQEAIARWMEPGEHRAKAVIHGQVIPIILRESGLVEWAGFAHGEDDQHAVPAWWRKKDAQE